jgi:predicted nucleotidyltransferase
VTSRFDARELFRVLNEHRVDYVTIGGIAVQAHGGQRVTQDLDVAVASSRANYELLNGALEELDARILGPEGQRSESVPSASLLASGDQWHLITPHGRIDIVTPPARLGSFDEMRKRAHLVSLGDLSVPIASREDLLILKRAAGRPQDLADIRLLESLDDGSK